MSTFGGADVRSSTCLEEYLMNDQGVNRLIDEALELRYSRRRIGQRAAVLGLSASAISAVLAATSGAQEASPSAVSDAEAYPEDVVAQAQEEGSVVLYTSLDTQIVEAIIAPFEERFDIEVEFFRAGSADVSIKVLQEAEAGRLGADVIDISDVAAFFSMKDRGYLEEYESPFRATIDPSLMDPDATWTACRLTHGLHQWNTELLKEEPPQTWAALADPAWQGQLATWIDPGGSEVPRLFAVASGLGWELLERIAENNPLYIDSPQSLTQLLEQGERAVGFAQNDNLAWRSKREGNPTHYLFPQDGAAVEIGAVGKAKDSPHPNAGLLLLNWWLGNEGQAELARGGKYSSRTDIASPEGSPPLAEINQFPIDYEEYEANREEIIDRLKSIFGG